MKRRITFIITIVLALSLAFGTVAYAAGGSGNGNGNGGSDNPPQESQQTGRLQYMQQIRQMIQEASQNRQQVQSKTEELLRLRAQVRQRLQAMKADPSTVTDEQIEQIQNLISQMNQYRYELSGTNPAMVQHRQGLRNARGNSNYETIISEYGSIIRLQEQRMDCLQQLCGLCQQILAV